MLFDTNLPPLSATVCYLMEIKHYIYILSGASGRRIPFTSCEPSSAVPWNIIETYIKDLNRVCRFHFYAYHFIIYIVTIYMQVFSLLKYLWNMHIEDLTAIGQPLPQSHLTHTRRPRFFFKPSIILSIFSKRHSTLE